MPALRPLGERPLLDADGKLDADVVTARRTIRRTPDGAVEHPQWDPAGDVALLTAAPIRFGWRAANRKAAGWLFSPIVPSAALLDMASAAGLTYVPQAHRRGCVAAAVAMLAGISYRDALRQIGGSSVFLHGATDDIAAGVLADHGITTRAWPYRSLRDAAVAHPSFVGVRMHGGVRHAAVLLPEGWVLDPLVEVPTRLEQYVTVTFLWEVVPASRA
jgi:hypothetical protein